MIYLRIAVVSLVIFVFIFSVASAGDVLFETVISRSSSWLGSSLGISLNDGFTYTQSSSIGYQPLTDQEVCIIKAGLYTSGSPTDSVVMTVRTSANNGSPIGGPVIASATVSADQVSNPPFLPQQTVYTNFSFSPCLNLASGVRYSFTLTRTQPGTSGNYVYQISNNISYPEISFWQYVPVNGFWQESIGYEPALRLEGPDGPANKEPVIIVPGILGSRLNRVSDGEEVWVNEEKMFNPLTPDDNYLDELKLDTSGNEIIDMYSGGIIESVLGANQYGNLIQRFRDDGYQLGVDLFLFPYDWRLDVELSSLELDSVVNQAITQSPTGKVNIIAHSMGGLVVKDYLMREGDSNINKLIFVGTPHLGAPKAFNALNFGDDFDLKFLSLGLNKNKAKDIAQNMPAVYELLPSREYISKTGSYVRNNAFINLDYDQINQFMTSSPLLSDYRNSNLLSLADQFHQSHDCWVPQSVSVYSLIGCQAYDTIGSFEIEDEDSIDINSVTGDGTVPVISANYISVGEKYFVSYPTTKIDHVGLIKDGLTVDLLHHLVTSAEEPVLPSGISKSLFECDDILNQVLRFSTHSPVNLHVYDSLGNHVGLTPEGNIETNIPDSNFLQVRDNTFIFVPDGASYSVGINAYATGSFDFKVKELNNGEVSRSIVYDNIPINNSELEADFEFTSIATSSLLDIDQDGDGENDIGYSSDGSRTLYHGIENVIFDINMAYNLGWIKTVKDRDSYLKKLEKVIKIENRIERLPDGSKKEKRIQRLEKKIDRVLAIQFLKDLEKDYNKGRINERAYNLLKEDILWLLEN